MWYGFGMNWTSVTSITILFFLSFVMILLALKSSEYIYITAKVCKYFKLFAKYTCLLHFLIFVCYLKWVIWFAI